MQETIQDSSWEIINNQIAIKTLDLSAFEYYGSGIPKGILFYFFQNDSQIGEKKDIELTIGDISYEAYIKFDNINRAQIKWHGDFKEKLFNEFPNWKTHIKQDKCLMEFHRINQHNYKKFRIELKYSDEFYGNTKLTNKEIMDYRILEREYEKFKKYLYDESGIEFTSFNHLFIEDHESYKSEIRLKARNKLSVSEWNKDDIGSGAIIKRLQKAISIKNNNLLIHDNRYGENSRQDKSLYDLNESELYDYEKVIFDFYKENISDFQAFKQLSKMAGRIYPFLSYLFYIKSDKKYLPISPKKFDDFFSEVNLGFITSGKASWENYNLYISYIKDVQEFLNSQVDIEDEVTLLDGHSFVWICSSTIGFENKLKKNNKVIIPEFKKTRLSNSSSNNKNLDNNTSVKTVKSDYFITQHKKNIAKGKKCENYVYHIEKQYLMENDLDELANKIKNVSNQLGLGYDILSFDLEGNEKYIEVKSGSSNSFYISKNELEKMQKMDNYWIYIVDMENDVIRTLRDIDVDSDSVVPITYQVYFDKN